MKIKDFEVVVHNTIEYIRKKYPNENNTMDRWLVLIGEEFGELCMAINDGETSNVIEEGTQTIAAIYLMLEAFSNQTLLAGDKKAVLDRMVDGVADAGNFQGIQKGVNDSLGGLLMNAGMALAEQKKLLNSAKTPEALQTALKLIGVTAGNLAGASTRMLSWMGKQLPKRDSTVEEVEDGALFNEVRKLTGGVTGSLSKVFSKALPRRDSRWSQPFYSVSKEGYEVHSQVIMDGVNNSILYRPKENDFMLAFGYNGVTGKCERSTVGYETFADADSALRILLEGSK